MSQEIKVVKNPNNGLTFTPGTSAESIARGFGKVMVAAETLSMSPSGILTLSRRVAFITTTAAVVAHMGLTDGKIIPGTIVRSIGLEPFWVKKDGKPQGPVTKGKDGAAASLNGAEYFQKYEYTMDSNAVADVFVLPKADQVPAQAEEVLETELNTFN